MKALAALILAALLAANGAFIFAASRLMPPRVASHFDAQGFATGYMPRDHYLLLMAAIGLGIPLLLAVALSALPYVAPTRLRIPARDYWIAPERREATLNTLATSGLIVASIVAAFMIAANLLVVQANKRTPPQLDSAALYTLIAGLVLALLAWQVILWRRFQVPR